MSSPDTTRYNRTITPFLLQIYKPGHEYLLLDKKYILCYNMERGVEMKFQVVFLVVRIKMRGIAVAPCYF